MMGGWCSSWCWGLRCWIGRLLERRNDGTLESWNDAFHCGSFHHSIVPSFRPDRRPPRRSVAPRPSGPGGLRACHRAPVAGVVVTHRFGVSAGAARGCENRARCEVRRIEPQPDRRRVRRRPVGGRRAAAAHAAVLRAARPGADDAGGGATESRLPRFAAARAREFLRGTRLLRAQERSARLRADPAIARRRRRRRRIQESGELLRVALQPRVHDHGDDDATGRYRESPLPPGRPSYAGVSRVRRTGAGGEERRPGRRHAHPAQGDGFRGACRTRLDRLLQGARRPLRDPRGGGAHAAAAAHPCGRPAVRGGGAVTTAGAGGATETPLMQQYRDIKARYPQTILFFRMGDFYEMFEDDAKLAARELGLTLTSRNNGGAAEVPLAGVPVKAATEYLRRLIGKGHRVAICEQVEDPKLAKGIVRREVVETVTPGTVLSDDWLVRNRNNFLVAVDPRGADAGLAALDLITGELVLETVAAVDLPHTLARYEPAEVVLPSDVAVATAVGTVTVREAWEFDPELAREDLLRTYGIASLDGLGIGADDRPGVGAAGALLRYARELKPGGLPHLAHPTIVRRGDVLPLDEMTRRNLELVEPLRTGEGGGAEGATLLDVIERA